MSDEEKKVVATDLSFLQELEDSPVGRRGGDATSDLGKVRAFVTERVLDPMIASLQTEKPFVETILTDLVKRLRSTAVNAKGEEVVVPKDSNGKIVLPAGHVWKFRSDITASDDRYREIRNYVTKTVKGDKRFELVEKYSTKYGKDRYFITVKQAVKAPAAAPAVVVNPKK